MIRTLINNGQLPQAFTVLAQRAAAYPGEGYGDRVKALQTEFGYMSDFMLQGYKDDSRAALFADLVQRVLDIDYDIRVRETLLENPYIKSAVKSTGAEALSAEALQETLVQAAAPRERFRNLSKAFVSLLIAGSWRQSQADGWSRFVSDGTTPELEAATLTSAITLSALYNFSAVKARCLADIYLTSQSETVRQRAFTGFMLVVSEAGEEHKADVGELLQRVFTDGSADTALLELQVQMRACANAEADASVIDKNIMPAMRQNRPFRFNKDGIVEIDDDKDGMDYDADEHRMEAINDAVGKMLKMQKDGSDIFFNGFRQTKRFPFFSHIANWFMPFTAEHPDISEGSPTVKDNALLQEIMERGPFCDSDKYSFIIAMASVLPQLPQNVREMLQSGEIGPLGMMGDAGANLTPSVIRLHYLQTLYRYFRINNVGSMLLNPFNHVGQYRLWTVASGVLSDDDRRSVLVTMMEDSSLFVAAEKGTEKAMVPVASDRHPLKIMLDGFRDKENFFYFLFHAGYMMLLQRYDDAIADYSRCLKMRPTDGKMMRSMARACYCSGQYDKASFYYDALHTMYPEHRSYVINYAMSMTMDGKAATVLNDMYRLEYENPDNVVVKNTLGWTLLYAGKAGQALALYEKLMAQDDAKDDFSVLLNAFYSYVANGKPLQAIALMRQYAEAMPAKEREEFPQTLFDAMQEDDALLRIYGIGIAERTILMGQVRKEGDK